MAGNPEALGSLAVEITGDYSPLEQAITDAQSAATAGADAIAQAFSISDNTDAAAQMQALSSAIEDTGTEATATGAQITDLQDQIEPLGSAAIETGDAVTELGAAASEGAGNAEELGASVESAGESAHGAEGQFSELLTSIAEFAGISLSVEGLKELGEEALTAYAGVQTATIALTALEGSAAKANTTIEGLEALANTDALSFPVLLQAAQRMIAFGFSAEQVPVILNAAANAAAATGNSFDMVTNAVDRMAISGTAGARQLASLGLSLNDLAAVMGTDASSVAADFKAMDPSDRLIVIEEALGKYAGVAQLTAQSISGQWQQLENAAHEAFVSIGSDIAPAASAIMAFAENSVIPATLSVIQSFAGVVTSAVGMVQELNEIGVTAGMLLGPFGSLYEYVQNLAGGAGFPSLSSTIVENITHWGALKAIMSDVSLVIETYTNKSPEIDQMNALINQNLINMTHSATTTNAAYIQATQASVAYNSAVNAAIKGQSDAVATLNANKSALDALTQSYQNQTEVIKGHVATLGDIARAQSAVDTATQQLTAHGKNWADTLAGVTDAANVSAEKEQSLATALAQAQAGFDAGTVSTGLFIDIYNKAQAAAKALGDTLIDVEAEEVKLNQASVNAQVTYGAEKQIFGDLLLKYEAGIIDLNELEASYTNVTKAATAAGAEFYSQSAAMLAAVDAAGKQDTALQNNIATLGGLTTASLQTTQVQQAESDVFKTITSEASAMGVSITNVGGVYQLTAKTITPAIQGIIDDLTKWMTQSGLTVAAVQQGFNVVKDATTGIVTYKGGVEAATTSVQAATPAHNAMANAVSGVGKAAAAANDPLSQMNDVVYNSQTGMYTLNGTVLSVGTSVTELTSSTTQYNSVQYNTQTGAYNTNTALTALVGGFAAVAGAASTAASAVEGFNTASQQTSGVVGGGGASGSSEVSGIASMMKMMGATGDMVTAFMGQSGFVSQNYSGNDFESVADYNASVTAVAKALGESVVTTVDQFGNTLDALGPPLAKTATAATTAATATTALATAATTAAAAVDTTVATSTDAYAALNDALSAAGDMYSELSDAQAQSITQQLETSVASGTTVTELNTLAKQLIAADLPTAVAGTATAATTAATALGTVAVASTAAATTIAAASTTVSNAAVATAATALQVLAAVPGANAQTGTLMSSSGVNLGALTLAPSASGSNALVATLTPGTGQSTPLNNSAPLQLTVNLNGGIVVGQNGMTQLTQMIMPQVTTLLRQAGAKV